MTTNAIDTFKGLMSPDNAVRKNAEDALNNKKDIPFNDALTFFLDAIKDSDDKVSQLAVLMFKKTFLDDERFMNSLDGPAAENLLNNVFFPLVDTQKQWKFLERVAENIAKLYAIADLNKSLNQIVTLFGNENPIVRQFAIFLLDSIAEVDLLKEEVIQTSIESFKELFNKGLEDQDASVRIYTLKATTTVLSGIRNKTLVAEFSCLSKPVINSLVYCLQNDKDGSKSKSCLETLNNLTEYHPKLWKNDLDAFLTVICEILSSEQIPKTLKQSTFQLILSFSKSTPAYLRKSSIFKNKFVPILMTLMKDLDNLNDTETWTTLTEDNDNDHEEMHYAAREGIELLAQDLGSKFFLDLVNPFISKFFTSQDWMEVHAAFVSVAWLAEDCKKSFKSELENLLK